MHRHRLTVILVTLIAALLTWYFWPAPPPSSASATTAAAPAPSQSAQSKAENPPAKISAPPPHAERSTLADTLNSPQTDLRADLRVVNEIIFTFRTNFPRDGNPVGTNSEITSVLTGKNKLRLALIPPDHPAISRTTGELLDRYGTPFFFHAESGTRMSITSAGPDKKLHTADDETFTP